VVDPRLSETLLALSETIAWHEIVEQGEDPREFAVDPAALKQRTRQVIEMIERTGGS